MPGEREKLSAVLAVRNDAAQIAGAVEGLRFTDEIIVLDLGSKDGAPEIARGLGCRVVREEEGAGAAARNAGFGAAAGPWILELEPGERLTAALRDEILGVLATSDPVPAAYSIPFAPYFLGKYLRHGGFRRRAVRLSRKGQLLYPGLAEPAEPVVKGSVGELRSLAVRFQHPRIRDFMSWMNASTSEAARFHVSRGQTASGLLAPALGVFWSRFVMQAGFLDGTYGFLAAALMAGHRFAERAKVWEALNAREEDAA